MELLQAARIVNYLVSDRALSTEKLFYACMLPSTLGSDRATRDWRKLFKVRISRIDAVKRRLADLLSCSACRNLRSKQDDSRPSRLHRRQSVAQDEVGNSKAVSSPVLAS